MLALRIFKIIGTGIVTLTGGYVLKELKEPINFYVM